MSEISESVASGSIGFRQSLPQDVAGKLSLALKYKEEGTVHFKAGNFKKAIATYAKVTAFTKGLPGSKRGLSGIAEMAGSDASVKPIDITDEQKAMEMEVAALTNIATCYLKLGEPRKALEFCAKALTSNPNAWKAALRKSEAQAMMGNYDVSRMTLGEALKIAPDAAAKSAIKIEREKMSIAEKNATKLSNSRQKKAFAKMFESEDLIPSANKPIQKSSSEEEDNSMKPASF